ncbi:MAG: PhzF family phenazine biosynthesis protein [Desulforhabdus sp.]|jgi:PhzF family phenazine biosynthesis protein|nr:PhzF family phenazine biosynthesis protein [Desulforhabdus sp.]
MRISVFQIDAFTSTLFAGNPAAVCPLDSWIDARLMQSIAMENNLSETAFFVRSGAHYDLRWFTPSMEVDLCGHATLAAAHVIFGYIEPSLDSVLFQTKSGPLSVQRQENLLSMDFPARPGTACAVPDELKEALGESPQQVFLARDYLVVYESEETIKSMSPDFNQLLQIKNCLGVIVTAPGMKSDFVSRFFAPQAGVPEDPVTGSAHCTLVPYWSQRLNKKKLHAFQLSRRGGELYCEDWGDRARIAGQAVTFLEGSIIL